MSAKRNRNRKSADSGTAPSPKKTVSRLTRLLDIPVSAVSNLCQMELSGNREAVVDGCQGILEYDENRIVLQTDKMNLRFTGRGLQVRVLTHTSAIVEGFITGIEFLS